MNDSAAFEAYRSSPPQPVTLLRLFVGLVIIAVCWIGASVLLVIIGSILSNGNFEALFETRPGTLGMFATFLGIWLGVWLAMRFVHREPLRNLLGVGGRVASGDFWRGLVAVALTSLLSEILIYAVWPELGRNTISLGLWLAYFVPVAILCLVQTSSEEILFRGYLMRGLANRFRSPWIWALIPSLAFLSLHFSLDMTLNDLALLSLTIGSLTAALVLVVYLTGNLGAAFGIHMGNNMFAFLLVSHQEGFNQFALLAGAQVDNDLGTSQMLTLVAISLVCVGLTVVMLVHPRSPLRVKGV